MRQEFSRTEMLLGREAMEKLGRSRVAVFGIGGVGGYVCEALARSGIGAFDLVDSDRVDITNLNRQIIATRKTIGQYKADVMRERILEINPEARIRVYRAFFLPENADSFPFEEYDYVVDAVDTVTAKLELIMRAKERGVPVISSMGAGNKLDASAFRVADIYETKVCPLAKVMRRELKKRGVEHLKVVYSEEMPLVPAYSGEGEERINRLVDTNSNHCMNRSDLDETGEVIVAEPACEAGRPDVWAEGGRTDNVPGRQREDGADMPSRRIPGSVAFVPSVAGLILAGEVVKDLVSECICPRVH